jgi:hypothetical protein
MDVQPPVYIYPGQQMDGLFGKILKIGSLGLIGGKKKPSKKELDAIATTTADQIAAAQVLAAQQKAQNQKLMIAGAAGVGLLVLLMPSRKGRK